MTTSGWRRRAPVLARYLGSRCQVDLGRVDAGARWWRELARAWPGRMTVVPHASEALPYIELGGSSWEEYLAGAQPAVPQPGWPQDARASTRPSGAGQEADLRRGGARRHRHPVRAARGPLEGASRRLVGRRSRGPRVPPGVRDRGAQARLASAVHARGGRSPGRGLVRMARGRGALLLPGGIRSGLGSPQRRLPAARRDRPEASGEGAVTYDLLLGTRRSRRASQPAPVSGGPCCWRHGFRAHESRPASRAWVARVRAKTVPS